MSKRERVRRTEREGGERKRGGGWRRERVCERESERGEGGQGGRERRGEDRVCKRE